jgi:hypothetical protein
MKRVPGTTASREAPCRFAEEDVSRAGGVVNRHYRIGGPSPPRSMPGLHQAPRPGALARRPSRRLREGYRQGEPLGAQRQRRVLSHAGGASAARLVDRCGRASFGAYPSSSAWPSPDGRAVLKSTSSVGIRNGPGGESLLPRRHRSPCVFSGTNPDGRPSLPRSVVRLKVPRKG